MNASPVAAATSPVAATSPNANANFIISGDYEIIVSKDFKISWHSDGNCRMNIFGVIAMATKLAMDPKGIDALARQGIEGMSALKRDDSITLAEDEMYHARAHIVLDSNMCLAITGSSAGEVDMGAIVAKMAPLFKELVMARMATM